MITINIHPPSPRTAQITHVYLDRGVNRHCCEHSRYDDVALTDVQVHVHHVLVLSCRPIAQHGAQRTLATVHRSNDHDLIW